jgi:hypothetical protein
MLVKLIQYWNVLYDRREDFDTFLANEFVPGIDETRLLKITGSWQVASGESPNFIVEGLSASLEEVEALVMGPDFSGLRQRLFHLVSDYSTKLMVPTGNVPTRPVEIEHGFKFTQHFNVNAADYYAYTAFVRNEHLPKMGQFGMDMVGGWYVAVGATPYVVAEARAEQLSTIGEMLENPEFQALTLKLLGLVSGYGCKILIPSGHVNP